MCITFITVYPFLLSLSQAAHITRSCLGQEEGLSTLESSSGPWIQILVISTGNLERVKFPLLQAQTILPLEKAVDCSEFTGPKTSLFVRLFVELLTFPDLVFWPVVMVNSGYVILLWAVVDCRISTFNTWWLVTGPLQCIINLASGCFTALDLTTFCSSSVTDSMKWHTWLYQVFVIEPSGPLLSWVYRLHTYFLLHLQFWLYLTSLIPSSFCLCVYIQELRMDAKSMPITSQHSVTEVYI